MMDITLKIKLNDGHEDGKPPIDTYFIKSELENLIQAIKKDFPDLALDETSVQYEYLTRLFEIYKRIR